MGNCTACGKCVKPNQDIRIDDLVDDASRLKELSKNSSYVHFDMWFDFYKKTFW